MCGMAPLWNLLAWSKGKEERMLLSTRVKQGGRMGR